MEPPPSPPGPFPPRPAQPAFPPPAAFPPPGGYPSPGADPPPGGPPGPHPPPGAYPPPGGHLPPGGPPPGGPPPGGPNRRGKTVGIIIAAVAAFVLCCGGAVTTAGIYLYDRYSTDTATDPPGGEPATPDRSGPIEWAPVQQNADTPLNELWGALADEFVAADPDPDAAGGVARQVELRAFPVDLYRTQLQARIVAGQPPDLFHSWGGAELRSLVEQGMVRDLTDDLADVIATLSPATLSPYTVDGRVYGLPYHMGVVGLWYNRTLFSDAGLDPDRPPATWDEFESAVAALDTAGIPAIAMAGAEDWPANLWFGCLATRVAGVDAVVQAHQTRSFTENPDFQRAAELLADLVAAEPFPAGYESAGYVGPNGQASLVPNGGAAMELMGQWAASIYQGESQTGDLDGVGWFPFPAVTDGRGAPADVYGNGDGFAVGVDAPDQTLELLRFIFSEQNHGRIVAADGGLLTTRAGAGAGAEPHVAAQLAAVQAAPQVQTFLDQELPSAVGAVLIQSIGALVRGELDPAQAMAQVTDAYQREPD